MRRILFTILVGLLVVSLAHSGTAIQTDWSGGAGVPGPVLDWSDTFHTTDGNVSIAGSVLELPWLSTEEHSVSESFDGASEVYSADIDGDGDMDVLGAGDYANSITWWENTDGAGTGWIEHSVATTSHPISVFSADINGDGDADVLGASYHDGTAYWFENADGAGTVWIRHDWVVSGPNSICSSDLDGDYDMDVLIADLSGGVTILNNMNGLGTSWTRHTIYYPANSLFPTDVNGDGFTDVLGASQTFNDITWWENTDGTGTVWHNHSIDAFLDANSVYAADVDGDGDTDVLVQGGNVIAWWENTDGAGTVWSVHTVDGAFDGASSICAADLDGDGDTDVLGAGGDVIAWWENTDGSGTAWTEHTVNGIFHGASSVHYADIDGDGNTDILGSAYIADDITWWKFAGFVSDGTLESSILDLDRLPEWGSVSWSSTEPAGTSVGVQLRSSASFYNMGAWSDTLFTSGTSLSGIISDSTQYLQYRVILETDNTQYTPILDEISISYFELITVQSPNEYTVWTHGWENVVLAWEYEVDNSFQQGDSVSIELFKDESFVADLTGGIILNTGQFTYPGPIPTDWEPGSDYHVVITDDADNFGSSDPFEIRAGVATEDMSSIALFSAMLLPMSPNPVHGLVRASIAVPETGIVELSVYDITGRIVHSSSSAVEAGYHSINLGELNQGIYYCRMITGDYTGSQRFVVIE